MGGQDRQADEDAAARERMVREQISARGVRDAMTLAAMRLVPREEFVPPAMRSAALADGALPIGRGQTISQPYMVARMTELLDLERWRREHPGRPLAALDVGTGSGYQAAILAQMGATVTSIERDADLAAEAGERLKRLGYAVEVIVGDGSQGHLPGAPYAAIVVGAAAPEVPRPLMDQLADGGALVVPVGSRDLQHLVVVRRRGDRFDRSETDPCVFVPLVGRFGHRAQRWG